MGQTNIRSSTRNNAPKCKQRAQRAAFYISLNLVVELSHSTSCIACATTVGKVSVTMICNACLDESDDCQRVPWQPNSSTANAFNVENMVYCGECRARWWLLYAGVPQAVSDDIGFFVIEDDFGFVDGVHFDDVDAAVARELAIAGEAADEAVAADVDVGASPIRMMVLLALSLLLVPLLLMSLWCLVCCLVVVCALLMAMCFVFDADLASAVLDRLFDGASAVLDRLFGGASAVGGGSDYHYHHQHHHHFHHHHQSQSPSL